MAAARHDDLAVRRARYSWLDHPAIARRYRERRLIDGRTWEEWVPLRLGGPAARGLDIGCRDGLRSLSLFENHVARAVDGLDPSEDAILGAERSRAVARMPGTFRVANLNADRLPRRAYDLIVASHCLHQVVALEHLLDEVYASLSSHGVFVLEGFVGPSRFQWTEAQMAVANAALLTLPDRLRMQRSNVLKTREGRPDRAALAAEAPFEAIRSGEISLLFHQRFEPVIVRRLGGTLQNLLYNGIIHNFSEQAVADCEIVEAIGGQEDALMDAGLLPSDFVLMIGARR